MLVIATKSMILMEDPEITSFARPLSKNEREERGPVNLGEEGFVLGVVSLVNQKPALIPPQVGKLYGGRVNPDLTGYFLAN